MKKNPETISLIGAGLVGSLLAVYLAKRGYKVNVYERRPDMRKEKIAAGRSINLALSERGWKGIAGAGLEEAVREIAIPMKGRMVHAVDGQTSFQPYGKVNEAIYSVSRGGINMKLMDLAEQQDGVQLFFNHKCEEVDLEKGLMRFETAEGKKQLQSDLIFGSDGAFSPLRDAMQRTDRFDYSQTYIEHSYKEMAIEANADGSFKLEKNALHIWPRKNFMLIALPNMDGSFTCTLFFQFKGPLSFSSVKTEEECEVFFKTYFPEIIELIPEYKKQFFGNPTSSLQTVRCYPWVYKNKAVLIGDAAHAIVPFFGQGMNCGFEDCTVLNELMNTYNENWDEVFPRFQEMRKPNSDAIAELALNNFIEMRDLVADPVFLRKKQIEKMIANKFPDRFIPPYSMVSFNHIPYSEALSKGKKIGELLGKLYEVENLESVFDSDSVIQLIESYL